MNRALRIPYVAVLLYAAGSLSAIAEEYDPYKVPKEQVYREVKTIAMMPVSLPPGTPNAVSLRARIEDLMTRKLRAMFTIIPAREYESTWIEMSERIGGVYDPVTGNPDEKKREAVYDHTTRELERRFEADATLRPYVGIGYFPTWIKAPFFGSPAFYSFDQVLTWQGKPLSGIQQNVPQRVLGSFLNAGLYDLSGVEMYGIRYPTDWTEIYVARSYEKRPMKRGQIYFRPRSGVPRPILKRK